MDRITGLLWLATCLATASAHAASLNSAPFGLLADGTPVKQYTMTATSGVSVSFLDYGGIVTDVTTPDRDGRRAPIVLGFPTLGKYQTIDAKDELYFGAILGRYANWIDHGRFRLHGNAYQITLTDPPNTIHGGKRGFDKRLWSVQPQAVSGPSVAARLSYVSADGEEGFPGKLRAGVNYSLSDDGSFAIHYVATTDRDTVVNLSSHMNFNLAGAGSPDGVLRQLLTVHAQEYMPLDRSQLPLGQLAPVAGTPFNFRTPTAIGAHIHDTNPQLAIANGYDNYWFLDKTGDPARPQLAVHVFDLASGRTLDVLTTEPGVQIYTADWFDGSIRGIGGPYIKYAAFTVETQHFPDSPNHPDYPTTELKPGQVFSSTTIFHFGVQK